MIELLAVIIILGVLLLIAIPSVTEYISTSRKKTYLATAGRYVDAVINKVNSLDYSFSAKDTMYYVPSNCIELEKGGKSLYGNWKEAYVVVIFNGDSYSYYWTSVDDSGMGIPLTLSKDLDPEKITGGMTSVDKEITVGGRTKIGEIQPTCGTTPTISYVEGTSAGGVLAEVVEIGDYVNYDAGTWTETKGIPTDAEPFTFGGYGLGNSRNSSVTCKSEFGIPSNNGWRVLSKNTSTGEVKLIHAGQPECYYHPSVTDGRGNSEKILSGSTSYNINSSYPSEPRDWSMYVNSTYAVSATAFTKSMLEAWNGNTISYGTTITDNDLIKTNAYYWLGSAYPSSTYYLDYMRSYGSVYYGGGGSGGGFGIRPVITMKSNIPTTGKVGNVWQLQ